MLTKDLEKEDKLLFLATVRILFLFTWKKRHANINVYVWFYFQRFIFNKEQIGIGVSQHKNVLNRDLVNPCKKEQDIFSIQFI